MWAQFKVVFSPLYIYLQYLVGKYCTLWIISVANIVVELCEK